MKQGSSRDIYEAFEEARIGLITIYITSLHHLVLQTYYYVLVQGESGGLGLGYVDINSVSFGGYPETELSQHNPVRDHQTHPVDKRPVCGRASAKWKLQHKVMM